MSDAHFCGACGADGAPAECAQGEACVVGQCLPTEPALLLPSTQPHWQHPLPLPPSYTPGQDPNDPDTDIYEVHVTQFQQWMGLLSPETGERLYTTVWGYGQVGHTYDVGVRDALGKPQPQTGMYVAPTFEAKRGRRVRVKWIDDRKGPDLQPLEKHLLEDAYDTTLNGTSMDEPHVRMVTHLHGGEVPPASDGFPDFWFTPDPNAKPNGMGGPAGNFAVYVYPNDQQPATLWYHDHSMGITRLNVMAGGAGLYLLREPAQEAALNLPSGPYEIPLAITDRMFNTDGSLSYVNAQNAPGTAYHPRQAPEFFGNVPMVNGMAWPYLEVEPRRYRFRLLNASNARVYNLRLFNLVTGQLWPDVFQIGSDGGYLAAPVKLQMTPVDEKGDGDDASAKLLLAPGERADIVVDFAGLTPGTTLSFTNDARAPFPDGDDPNTTELGEILRFHVIPPKGSDTSSLPASLNPLPTRLDAAQATVVRHLVLTEIEDPVSGSPIVGLLNNTCWDAPITESPKLGSTEIWEIVDATEDTHPIHLHLVQFNLLNRQRFDVQRYLEEWNQASPVGGNLPGPVPTCPSTTDPLTPPGVASWPQVIPPVDPFVTGSPVPPAPNEAGWKDTVRVKKGTVTRLLVRFAPQDPVAKGAYGGFSFDPTAGKYVWHCHILEHEDNEMMRPYQITQ
jgi:FtsP/CotA-like multicopper oxidase with cupredoxin domain